MQKIKVTISLLLLAFYAFGLMHSMMPHFYYMVYHGDEISHEKKAIFHKHIQATAGDHPEHIVHHMDHYDENFFGLIICLFDETEHPHGAFHHKDFVVEQINASPFKLISKARALALLFAFSVTDGQAEKILYHPSDDTCLNASYHPGAYPHRGPPSFIS